VTSYDASKGFCPYQSPQICLQVIAGVVQCVWHTNHYSSCIAEIVSGSLESDKCCYSKAMNEMIISFGKLIHCCTVQLQVGISLVAHYLGHSSAHRCVSRRPDHTSSKWLTGYAFAMRKL